MRQVRVSNESAHPMSVKIKKAMSALNLRAFLVFEYPKERLTIYSRPRRLATGGAVNNVETYHGLRVQEADHFKALTRDKIVD